MLRRNHRYPCLVAAACFLSLVEISHAAESETIDEIASRFQIEQGLPGLVVASVAQSKTKGLQIWTGAYGHANIANDEPLTTDTSLWLASLTKAFTGTTMAKAKEQGYLTYDTKVSDILQSFVIGDTTSRPWLSDITLEELATHRSTIQDNMAVYLCGYYVGDKQPGNHTLLMNVFGVPNPCIEDSPVTLGEFLEAYLSVDGAYYNETTNFLPPDIMPGAQSQYSNIGASLAGYLIGLATNTSLPDYTTQEIFHLLGMDDTSFRRSDLTQIATPYSRFDGAVEEYMELPIYDLATFPDGGLRSSVNDLAKFLGMIMNNGTLDLTMIGDEEEPVLSDRHGAAEGESVVMLQPETVADMLTPRYDGGDHAIFWFVTELSVGGKVRPLIGHNGGDPGAFSYLFFDPSTLTGYIIVGNGEADFIDPYALANLTAALFAHADELAAQGDDYGDEPPLMEDTVHPASPPPTSDTDATKPATTDSPLEDSEAETTPTTADSTDSSSTEAPVGEEPTTEQDETTSSGFARPYSIFILFLTAHFVTRS